MSSEVGIRELRQNLSAYLRRVKDGEAFIVTDHNRRVAELRPVADEASRLRDRLVRDRGVIPATRAVEDLPRPEPLDHPGGTAALLDEQRSERRS
jgi:prevent-host-death family protein